MERRFFDICIPNGEIKTQWSDVCPTILLQTLVIKGDGEGKAATITNYSDGEGKAGNRKDRKGERIT